jgi:photosystem II stability/assembly factor-like uncharacterized protein
VRREYRRSSGCSLKLSLSSWLLAMLFVTVCLSTTARQQKIPAWKVVERLPSRLWPRIGILIDDPRPLTVSRPPSLYSIEFLDDLHGWSVGEGGTVLRTTDGGKTWKMVVIEDAPDLYSVFFQDSQEGWTAGNLKGLAAIYRTRDGGQMWFLEKRVTDFFVSSISRVWFANQTEGWAVGEGDNLGSPTGPEISHYTAQQMADNIHADKGQDRYGLVFRTDDGGSHWNLLHTERATALSVGAHFLDERSLWVALGDSVIRTNDGGRIGTWCAFLCRMAEITSRSEWTSHPLLRVGSWEAGTKVKCSIPTMAAKPGSRWLFRLNHTSLIFLACGSGIPPKGGWAAIMDSLLRSMMATMA